MYRGEALEDFTGPDCRFVNFKKGDTLSKKKKKKKDNLRIREIT